MFNGNSGKNDKDGYGNRFGQNNNRPNNRYNNNRGRDEQDRRINTSNEGKFDISNPPPTQMLAELKVPQECRQPHNLNYIPQQFAPAQFQPFNYATLKPHDIKLEINARNHYANRILNFPQFREPEVQEKVAGWITVNGIDYAAFQNVGDELVSKIIKSLETAWFYL